MPDALKDLDEMREVAREWSRKLNQVIFIFRETSQSYQYDRLWIDTRPLHLSFTRFTLLEEVKQTENVA